ncbi:hypothetical protein EOD04_30095 [Mesorhizobium sp. M2C.T.Ca.TU.009.01.2.1]|nr:hypothetical protein EOD07_16930 [Mesorhizobium sp. M2C.T.Ca.TU.002.02.1.1]RUU57340.1 hypothetical protein EOD04_30095 [Mesorhizobium sp. M2C.T.Ca.TU.009.01.2.1]
MGAAQSQNRWDQDSWGCRHFGSLTFIDRAAAHTRAVQRFTESPNRSNSLVLRNSGRKTATHFSWNCSRFPRVTLQSGSRFGWPDIEISSGPVVALRTASGETKIEQIQILIVFQIFVASCQMRTKKVQIGRDHGLSGLH